MKFLLKIKEKQRAEYIVCLLFAAVFAGSWDVWWHGFLGRESFWSPPHLLLYLSVTIAIILGVAGIFRHRQILWKIIGGFLIVVPLSAPFDEWWHQVFGVETLESVLVLWSPPHLALIISILAVNLLLLPLLLKDVNRSVFSLLALTNIFSLLSLVAQPFDPIGPWHLLGFWGAGVFSFILVLVLSFAKKHVQSFGSTFMLAMFLVVVVSIGFAEPTSSGSEIADHAHLPGWLIILSILTPAFFIALCKKVAPHVTVVAACVSAGILYGFGMFFIEESFRYSLGSSYGAFVSASIAGLVAWFAITASSRIFNRRR